MNLEINMKNGSKSFTTMYQWYVYKIGMKNQELYIHLHSETYISHVI